MLQVRKVLQDIQSWSETSDYSKFEVAKLGIELGAPIGKTFSCQASPDVPCGACPNCVDRLGALKRLSEWVKILK